MSEKELHTPNDLFNYKGEFVVFFSEDIDPKILFHSLLAEEAYKKAHEIKEGEGREPVVYRVQECSDTNISQVLALRY